MSEVFSYCYVAKSGYYNELHCWTHRWPHVERVYSYAKIISEQEIIDSFPCIISAYCHDIGRLEEEKRKRQGESFMHHALLSIEPTTRILNQVGISGPLFGEIVEAVIVHSYRIYEGKNNTARVLQDADKGAGFGLYGVLSAIKYFGNRDYVPSDTILKNSENPEEIKKLLDITLERIDEEVAKKTLKGLDFIVEWFDMLHTNSARNVLYREYEQTREMRDQLSKKLS